MGTFISDWLTTSIREWLNDANFNWEVGVIIIQDGDWNKEDSIFPITRANKISHDSPILDRVFGTGYGGTEAPLFIAEDDKCIYFADQYDGAQSLVVIQKDITKYLDFNEYRIPLPGGG